jgi:hypothetical protein
VSASSACPGCGVVLPAVDGPRHDYIGSSAACWAKFGELLAVEFENPSYFAVHQLTVDTYAAQHPGEPSRRSTQSVTLHLITLGLTVETGAAPAAGTKLHARLTGGAPLDTWLEPPPMSGRLTVVDALDAPNAAEHRRRIEAWAADVWAAWAPHHETVRGWARERLGSDWG